MARLRFDRYGYVVVRVRGSKWGTGLHVLVAEHALGRELPRGARVHHVNGDKTDNRPSNLVVCPNDAYHSLLHLRQAALDACGNPDWRRCLYCGAYDDTAHMIVHARGSANHTYCHQPCRSARQKQQRATERGAA